MADKRSDQTGPHDPGENNSGQGHAEESELSAEEQMSAFEDDLKENDWGHQPC